MASRRIVTIQDVERLKHPPASGSLRSSGMAVGRRKKALTTTTPDKYSDALVKLVPADVVAGFLAIDGIVRGSLPAIGERTYWLVYAILVTLCAWWVKRGSDAEGLPPA